jgi:hypothetical protein
MHGYIGVLSVFGTRRVYARNAYVWALRALEELALRQPSRVVTVCIRITLCAGLSWSAAPGSFRSVSARSEAFVSTAFAAAP